MADIVLDQVTRACDGCTKCCDGHLTGTAHGYNFFKGTACHFRGTTGCTIYKQRPEDPCVSFKCAWLLDTNRIIPEWLKPNISDVIIIERPWGQDKFFWEVNECDKQLSSVIFAWLMIYHMNNQLPMSIQAHGAWYHFGPEEFLRFKNAIS
jgi:hypothetical protein